MGLVRLVIQLIKLFLVVVKLLHCWISDNKEGPNARLTCQNMSFKVCCIPQHSFGHCQLVCGVMLDKPQEQRYASLLLHTF